MKEMAAAGEHDDGQLLWSRPGQYRCEQPGKIPNRVHLVPLPGRTSRTDCKITSCGATVERQS